MFYRGKKVKRRQELSLEETSHNKSPVINLLTCETLQDKIFSCIHRYNFFGLLRTKLLGLVLILPFHSLACYLVV